MSDDRPAPGTTAIDLGRLARDAERALSPAAFAYAAGGSDDEHTAAGNVDAWTGVRLRPHVLRDVSNVSTATTVLGRPVASPVLAAPTAMQRLFHPDGELATAEAVAAAGSVMVLSVASTTAVEDVAAAIVPRHGRLWMHVAIWRDRGRTKELCQRARDAGCQAIVLTVDCPVPARRPRSEAQPFVLPIGVGLPNAVEPGRDPVEGLLAMVDGFDPSVTFDDIEAVEGWSGGLPVVVKGVVRGDDARRCIEAGAAAVAVSNHGGRQLDQCIATAHALPEVADALGGEAEVYVDGGIRRGAHVLAALALGATAVLVGRPLLYGLALRGQAGVAGVLDQFDVELARSMALCGVTGVGSVPPDLVAPDGRWPEAPRAWR